MQVVPGDVFVLHPGLTPDSDLEAISVAVEQGAALILAPYVDTEDPGLDPVPDPVGMAGILPPQVPLVRVEDSLAMGARLAAAFYGEGSGRAWKPQSLIPGEGPGASCGYQGWGGQCSIVGGRRTWGR